MRNNQDVESLTRQLESLRIERERINDEEKELIEAIRRASSPTPRDTTSSSYENPPRNRRDEQTVGDFSIGQRVLITNRLTHLPSGQRPTIKDRAAVVKRVTGARVHVITYNGAETNRAPGNLTRLSRSEHDRIVNAEPN